MPNMKRLAVNVSAHHTNGVSTPAKTYTDVRSVDIEAPALEWLRHARVEFNKDGSLAVSVQYIHPHDGATWAEARLIVRPDGTVTLDT